MCQKPFQLWQRRCWFWSALTVCVCARLCLSLLSEDRHLCRLSLMYSQRFCKVGIFLKHFHYIKWVWKGEKIAARMGERQKKSHRERETKRDVICLQSIGCTPDHSWEPTIICFHLLASFHFFPPFLFNTLSLYFSLLIPIQLKLAILAGHWLIAQGPSIRP